MVTKVLGSHRLGAGALGTYPSAVLTAPCGGLALISKVVPSWITGSCLEGDGYDAQSRLAPGNLGVCRDAAFLVK